MWAWSDQEMEMRIEYRQILQSRFAAIYEAAGEIETLIRAYPDHPAAEALFNARRRSGRNV